MRANSKRLPDMGEAPMQHVVRDLNRPGCRVSRCGLELDDTLKEISWREIGEVLGRIASSQQWWVGDWWAFGQHRYGDRSVFVEAEGWQGPAFQTCMNAASVCRQFETSRRREVLSFAHHEVVAALSSSEADALLDWATGGLAETGTVRSVRALREERWRREREGSGAGSRVVRVMVTQPSPKPQRVTVRITPAIPLPISKPDSPRPTDANLLRSFFHAVSSVGKGDDPADLAQLVPPGEERHYLELAEAAERRLALFVSSLRIRITTTGGRGGKNSDGPTRH